MSACAPAEPEQANTIVTISAAAADAPHTASIASPAKMPAATPDLRPRKTFVDPPLPPELLDDGGLTPLPPPPLPAGANP